MARAGSSGPLIPWSWPKDLSPPPIFTPTCPSHRHQPIYDLDSAASPGVLIFPIVLQDSTMFVVTSDAAEASTINLRDTTTGAHLTLQVPALQAAIALVSKEGKNVVAKYGF